jgi:NTE family protein
VIFGAPDAPRAGVSEAVLASCAVPWLFAPVEIGGREYVDGGVWSPTNLDAVPAGRGSRVLCLVPTAGAMLTPLRTATTAAAGYEAMALRARGVTVRTIVPDGPSLDAIGPNLMDPRGRDAVAAAGYAQGRRLTAPG